MTLVRFRLGFAWRLLRLGLGAGLLVAGADKFANRLATWSMYVSPLAERLLPVPEEAFLRAAGVLEMALGLAILLRWTRRAAYLASAWLVAIAANLAAAGTFWDLVLRDLELAIAAFALARLTEWHESLAPSPRPSRAPAPGAPVPAHAPVAGAGIRAVAAWRR